MAFATKIGNLVKQAVTSNSSMYQAIRCMSNTKVFVGGLSYSTDEQSLGEAFRNYGEVIEAKVIRDRESGQSRGFGFVTFTSTEEASAAISSMDAKDLQGRIVRVNYANDRRDGGGYGGGGYGGGGYGGGAYGGAGYGGGGYGGAGSGGYDGGSYSSGGGGYGGNSYGNAGGGYNGGSGGGSYGGGADGSSGNYGSSIGNDNYTVAAGSVGFAGAPGADGFGSSGSASGIGGTGAMGYGSGTSDPLSSSTDNMNHGDASFKNHEVPPLDGGERSEYEPENYASRS